MQKEKSAVRNILYRKADNAGSLSVFCKSQLLSEVLSRTSVGSMSVKLNLNLKLVRSAIRVRNISCSTQNKSSTRH